MFFYETKEMAMFLVLVMLYTNFTIWSRIELPQS